MLYKLQKTRKSYPRPSHPCTISFLFYFHQRFDAFRFFLSIHSFNYLLSSFYAPGFWVFPLLLFHNNLFLCTILNKNFISILLVHSIPNQFLFVVANHSQHGVWPCLIIHFSTAQQILINVIFSSTKSQFTWFTVIFVQSGGHHCSLMQNTYNDQLI